MEARSPRLLIIAVVVAVLAVVRPYPTSALSCAQGPYIIFFDHGNAFVDSEARAILDNAVAAAGNCGYAKTTIAGHTDTSEKTGGLDVKRARTVKAYLAARGFPEDDIDIAAFGATVLRIPTEDNVEERENRRVEITFGPF